MIRTSSPKVVCKRLEVLHDRREVELVASAGKPSQSHTLKPVMRLKMRKPHLHFLAIVTRFVECWGTIKCTGFIASIFVYVARDFALGASGTALGLERTWPAIMGARVVAPRVVRENASRGLQQFSRRTDIDVPFLIEFEVAA